MSNIEGSEGHNPPEHQRAPIEIGITPDSPEEVVFRKTQDGGLTIFLKGEMTIRLNSEHTQAAESLVPGAETVSSGLIPESTSPHVREPHSGSDKPSWERPLKEGEDLPESENEKYQLTGNVARIGRYRVTKKSNTKIADLVLATHPDEETTEYWRIRAFGKQSEKVRETVKVGQKLETTVYGPKYWRGSKKTSDGWEETVVKGYHAGFLKQKRTQEQAPQSHGDMQSS
jgi:hypothetical protein